MCSASGQQDGSGFSEAGWPRMPDRQPAGGYIMQAQTMSSHGEASHGKPRMGSLGKLVHFFPVVVETWGGSSCRLGTARPGGVKLHEELSYLLSLPMQYMLDASALTARLLWPNAFPILLICMAGVGCCLGKCSIIVSCRLRRKVC